MIGVGGFIGAVLRYLVGGWVQNGFNTFPAGTLAVNVIGSFFLGFIMYGSEYRGFFPDEARIFLTIGILGAFTTMSTFSYETFKLLDAKEYTMLALNVLGTLFSTVFAVYLGRGLALYIWGN